MSTANGKPTKAQRQHRIALLLGKHSVTSQPQLVELLADEGVVATQTTVSRDLEDLGAVKVRIPGGETAYAIPEYEPSGSHPDDHLRRVLSGMGGRGRAVREPRRAPHAPGLARTSSRSALDRSGLEGLLGTVAGDDTLLCVAAEKMGGDEDGEDLARPRRPHERLRPRSGSGKACGARVQRRARHLRARAVDAGGDGRRGGVLPARRRGPGRRPVTGT